jgi:hypothetical protein
MSIKQQGGIFGRNPTFNNLTAEQVNSNGTIISSGNVGINTSSPAAPLHVVGNTYVQSGTIFTDAITSFSGTGLVLNGGSALTVLASGTQATFNASGLAFPSGNGIDFSATSGTGTSELFDDYEEGTWTPAFAASAGSFGSITYTSQLGFYTKIGNTVTVSFFIAVASVTIGTASGALVMSGLPFTASSGGGTTQFQTAFVTQGPDFMQFYGSGTNVLLRSKTATSFANVAPTEIQASTELHGTLTYFV